MKYEEKVKKFMYGRYGILDEFYKFLIILCCFLLIINLFINSIIIKIIELILLSYSIFRILSKKIYKRSNENQIYLKIINKIKSIFKPYKKDKNYIYKKCHHCHKKLKLPIPYEIGIKHSKCPNCKMRNSFLILRKQKVEIIK